MKYFSDNNINQYRLFDMFQDTVKNIISFLFFVIIPLLGFSYIQSLFDHQKNNQQNNDIQITFENISPNIIKKNTNLFNIIIEGTLKNNKCYFNISFISNINKKTNNTLPYTYIGVHNCKSEGESLLNDYNT